MEKGEAPRTGWSRACLGLLLVATPALAGGARTSAGGPWLTTGNSINSNDFLGTLNSAPLTLKTNGAERMRITNAGKIGIGTSSPADPLSLHTATNSYGLTHTDGSTTLGTYVGAGRGWIGTKSNSPLSFFTNNGGPLMTLLASSGNVGIGTTLPNDKLAVRTATNSYGVTQSDGTTTVGTWVGAGGSGIPSGWLGTKTNHPLRLFTSNGSAPLNIYPSGEVGVGSYLQYGAKLSVRSATGADAGRFDNTTAGRAITATSAAGDAILGVSSRRIDPAHKTLLSAPVDANERLNVFSGNVVTGPGGKALVPLPAYYSAANKDPRYQLTVVGQFAQAIVGREIEGNTFTIRTNKPNVKVSWQVTAKRNDPWSKAHPFRAVQNKTAAQRGKYYTPAAYGKTARDSIAPPPNAVASAPKRR